MNSPELQFSITVQTTAAEAFRAFTHETALRDWLSAAAFTVPAPGGCIFLQWPNQTTVQGVFKRYEPGKALEFSWQALNDPAADVVEVTFVEKETETHITLTHHMNEYCEAGKAELTHAWTKALENLKSMLETGVDLRQTSRPRMGIFMDELNAEIAEKFGFAVTEGVRISGVTEGAGAHKAGLTKDDIIIRLDGTPTPSPAGLGDILGGHKAGDHLVVEFYRGAEKRTTDLELSCLPVPQFPENGTGLAQSARTLFERILTGMGELTAGLSEAQADYRPAAGEWNVKELIGHFILCERDFQSWTADMLIDNPVSDYLNYRPNVNERLGALIQRLGTLDAMLVEMKLAFEESLVLMAALPESFTRFRKHNYHRMATWALIIVPGHYFAEHAQQFITTIAAARNAVP